MAEVGGYAGRVLRVDLTERRVAVEETDSAIADLFLGGRGYAAKVLFDEVPPGTPPLGPANKLIFGTGPLTGTLVPGCGRHLIVTKSPQTNLFLDSYSGGHFATELKQAGYDFIIVEGRATRPSYLWIRDDDVQIRDAGDLWGMTAWDAETRLKEEVGDKHARVSLIGPAGERLSNLAGVQNDYYHQCGRGGGGAVMGSKNLKAVVVRGGRGVRIARPAELLDWLAKVEARVQSVLPEGPVADRMKMGTPLTLNITNQVGILPTMNYLYGDYEGAPKIDGYAFRERVIADVACYSCSMGCTKIARPAAGPYAKHAVGGPEYETAALFGANCGVDSMDDVIYANVLCDSLGLDTVGTGNVIGWAMECFEKGILSEQDTGGIDLRFGNSAAMFELIRQIAYREGIGDLLANGVKIAAERIGRGSEQFAMHVKGLEYPAYRPGPASPAFGLVYAITERGACHRRAWPSIVEGATLAPFVVDGRAQLVKTLYDQRIPWHCGLTCDIVVIFFGMDHGDAATALSAVTGRERTTADMQELCERVASLIRVYNIREGATAADDTLAPRSFQPDRRGRGEGRALTPQMLEAMKQEYYRLRGWDTTGTPSPERLVELGMPEVAVGAAGRREQTK